MIEFDRYYPGKYFGRFEIVPLGAGDMFLLADQGGRPKDRYYLVFKSPHGVGLYPCNSIGVLTSPIPLHEEESVSNMFGWIARLPEQPPTRVSERPKPKNLPQGWVSEGTQFSYSCEDFNLRVAETLSVDKHSDKPLDLIRIGHELKELGSFLAWDQP